MNSKDLLSTTPNSDLLVTIKSVYGNELIYPACEKGALLCQLAGSKTFTCEAIKLCKQLGYTFVITSQQPRSL